MSQTTLESVYPVSFVFISFYGFTPVSWSLLDSTLVPFFTEHDGSPIVEDTRKNNSRQPLAHIALTSEHETSVTTATGDGARFESVISVKSDVLSAQETGISDDYNYGDIPLETSSSSITRDRASYNDARLPYAPEPIGNKSSFTKKEMVTDSHRNSKTEFQSIPEEVVPIGLDMARCPDTGSQVHRKSSTEFVNIPAPDTRLAKQPYAHNQATTLPPVVPKPHPTAGEKQDNGGRKVGGQLWQEPSAQESTQHLWR
ncbi:hypothetical protein CSUB01_09703 [Colletotrichum sublineola]|uniref:Uncharacterized protein n=1 Tax=Colletotrichum sublineola TaxID=1173701 RepID=A0A066XVE0_COLSU|nr:hypothetical protein CSUB01_09703 [Colletotrichum sublineola]